MSSIEGSTRHKDSPEISFNNRQILQVQHQNYKAHWNHKAGATVGGISVCYNMLSKYTGKILADLLNFIVQKPNDMLVPVMLVDCQAKLHKYHCDNTLRHLNFLLPFVWILKEYRNH